MCKLAFAKTKEPEAYHKVINMIKHQENVVAGHSTGIAWHDSKGRPHMRKAVGKVINFLAEYPDIPKTTIALGHSRFASVGEINKANQHPITILYKGKRIGYGIHNGTWSDYSKYEYMRNPRIENKTDSAVIFAIYADILEKIGGDTGNNRRIALATLQQFLSKTNQASQNLIIMFDNRQVLFSGFALTYFSGAESLGIMTFGLPNAVNSEKIYSVYRYGVREHSFITKPYELQPEENEEAEEVEQTCSVSLIPDDVTEEKPTEIQTSLDERFKFIDSMLFKLEGIYRTQEIAQAKGEKLKQRWYGPQRYRTIEMNGMWRLYVR